MRALALHGAVRRWLTRLHRWSGLVIFPLHTGTAFGLAGRIVIAVAGLVLVGLMVTGLYVWAVKWRMRYRFRRVGANF